MSIICEDKNMCNNQKTSTKYCNQCQKDKDTSLFSKNKASRDGFSDYCRECFKIRKDYYRAKLKDPNIGPPPFATQEQKRIEGGFYDDVDELRRCTNCTKEKPLNKFSYAKGPGGRSYTCKECKNENAKIKNAENRVGIKVDRKEQGIERRKATCLEVYKTEYPMQNNDILKNQQAATKRSCGVENYAHSEKYRQEVEERRKEREANYVPTYKDTEEYKNLTLGEKISLGVQLIHGEEYTNNFQVPAHKEKARQTTFENLGVYHGTQSPVTRQKYKDTCLERYDVDNTGKVLEFQEKARRTCIEKWKVDHFTKTQMYRDLIKARILHVQPGLPFTDYCRQYNLRQAHSRKVFAFGGFEALEKWRIERISPFVYITHLELEIASLLGIEKFDKPLKNYGINYRPDFKLLESLYLDIDGIYWHSMAKMADEWYHFKKRSLYEDKKLRVLQFRQDELEFQKAIVVSNINAALGKNQTIDAKDCSIVVVSSDTANYFHLDNNLKKDTESDEIYSLGLYYQNQLVQIVSVEINDPLNIEIKRISTLLDYYVLGGLEKLMDRVIDLYKPTKIITTCDLRYEDGSEFEAFGFVRESEEMTFRWTNYKYTFPQDSVTDEEAAELGWSRIYDAGQRLYVKTV